MTSPLVQAMTFQNSVSPAQTGISPTDVIGSYKLASDVAEKNYQAQLAKQQAMFGGLAGLGGAGILGFGPTIAKKLFGAGVTPATTTAATPLGLGGDAAAAAPLDTGATLGNTMSVPLGLGGSGATSSLPWPGASAALGAGDGASVAGDLGMGGGAALSDAGAGSVAADLAAAAPGVAGAGAADAAGAGIGTALAGLPDWLASLLPFLAAA